MTKLVDDYDGVWRLSERAHKKLLSTIADSGEWNELTTLQMIEMLAEQQVVLARHVAKLSRSLAWASLLWLFLAGLNVYYMLTR